jgi:hypothetical protein
LKQGTAESTTGMAEKCRWDQANSWQKPGLVWRNRKKNSQITKDYFYLPFFLLIILCIGILKGQVKDLFYFGKFLNVQCQSVTSADGSL